MVTITLRFVASEKIVKGERVTASLHDGRMFVKREQPEDKRLALGVEFDAPSTVEKDEVVTLEYAAREVR